MSAQSLEGGAREQETDAGDPLIVLMHGDRKVSTRELARVAGVKRIFPCKPEVAQRHSGYLVGGTSPFGTRKKMPIYLERSVLDLDRIGIADQGSCEVLDQILHEKPLSWLFSVS